MDAMTLPESIATRRKPPQSLRRAVHYISHDDGSVTAQAIGRYFRGEPFKTRSAEEAIGKIVCNALATSAMSITITDVKRKDKLEPFSGGY